MKFYQTIAPVMFGIMCATTIFGSEVNICGLKVPPDICNLIDELSGDNDGIYEKIGHVKPYSHLKKYIQYVTRISVTAVSTVVLFLTVYKGLFKAFPTLFKAFPEVMALYSPLVSLFCNSCVLMRFIDSSVASHLGTKSPRAIAIWDDFKEIAISGDPIRKPEIRSFSNMQLKDVSPLARPVVHKALVEKNEITYKLTSNGKLDIYLANNDYEPPKDTSNNPQHKHDYQSKNKLSSLPTTEKIITFAVSESRIIVTASKEKDGIGLKKWKLQPRKGLHEIMNTD